MPFFPIPRGNLLTRFRELQYSIFLVRYSIFRVLGHLRWMLLPGAVRVASQDSTRRAFAQFFGEASGVTPCSSSFFMYFSGSLLKSPEQPGQQK